MTHLARRSIASLSRTTILRRRCYSVKHETDSTGIPVKPTWSVHELLASYPSPSLPNDTLFKLHRLSALLPPEENTPEFEKLKGELEQLVKLVEAVKLVDTTGIEVAPPPVIPEESEPDHEASPGRTLLDHSNSASRDEGFYVVKTPRNNTPTW